MKIFFKIKKNRRGMSLLLTMIILASVLGAIVGLSVLIINELKLSRNINHSILAYYAAETGIEKGLYDINQNRIGAENLDDTITDLLNNQGTLENGAQWDTGTNNGDAVKTAFDMFTSVLNQDQSVQFSLFDPGDIENEPGDPYGVHQLAITYDFPESPEADLSVEVTIVEINKNTGVICQKIKKDWWDYPAKPPNYYVLDVDSLTDSPYCGDPAEDIFQVRIKALNDKIYNLRVVPYDNTLPNPVQLSIESGIRLQSVGEYSRSRQSIMVRVPWQLAASDFLDYVIFSQEELNKN